VIEQEQEISRLRERLEAPREATAGEAGDIVDEAAGEASSRAREVAESEEGPLKTPMKHPLQKGQRMADPAEILNRRNREVEQIRAYVDLTEEAKAERIAAVTEKANSEFAAAKEAEKQRREERLKNSERGVFAVVDDVTATPSEAEKAQIHAAYRQGSGDVYWATMEPGEAPAELEGILTEAERTDDTLMAKAAYHRAIDLGLQPIIDRYLADRPKEERAMERYAAAVEVARGDWPQWRAA
jgi:hypothetical protein